MLSRLLLSSLCLALVCPVVLAQDVKIGTKRDSGNGGVASSSASYPHKEIEYLDSAGVRVSSVVGAHHRREISYRDARSGIVKEFYSSGKLKDFTTYASIPDNIRHGVHMIYYETGQISVSEGYSAALLEGERLMYYPTGVLRRRDLFEKGVRIKGEYFTADGAPAAYVEAEEMPTYETGGLHEIVAAIARLNRYPKMAQFNEVQGRVIVAFNVSETGDVVDIRVVNGVYMLGEAAIKAVQGLHRFVKPGRIEGVAVKVAFTVPVTYLVE